MNREMSEKPPKGGYRFISILELSPSSLGNDLQRGLVAK